MSLIEQDRINGRVILKGATSGSITFADSSSYAAVAGSAAGFNISRTEVSLAIPFSSGSALTGAIPIGASGELFNVQVDNAARIRFYTTATLRDADFSRASSTYPIGKSGLLVELVLSGSVSILDFPLSPIVTYANGDTPKQSQVYYTIQPFAVTPGTLNITCRRIVFEA